MAKERKTLSVDKTLAERAEKEAEELGLSSPNIFLQDAVAFYLQNNREELRARKERRKLLLKE